MKIGIITIQKSPTSYGGNLQSYALWSFLNSKGYNVEIIDLYRPAQRGYINSTENISYHTYCYNKKDEMRAPTLNIFDIRTWLRRIKTLEFHKSMLKFSNRAKYSKPYKSIDELYAEKNLYDIYISGSDQIWNPDMKFEMAPYFLDFIKNRKKISYASSFGKTNITIQNLEQIKKWLKRYSFISVRERSGKELLNSLGITSEIVMDPTFLISKNEWINIEKPIKNNKKYIFVFLLYQSKEIINIIKTLAKKEHLEVYSNKKEKGFHNIALCSVHEWIGYINAAQIVITDSFHATAFSLILNKNFYSIISNSQVSVTRSTRILNLLELLQIPERCIDEKKLEEISLFKEVNYSKVNDLLNRQIEFSKEYLMNSIKNDKI